MDISYTEVTWNSMRKRNRLIAQIIRSLGWKHSIFQQSDTVAESWVFYLSSDESEDGNGHKRKCLWQYIGALGRRMTPYAAGIFIEFEISDRH